MLVCFSNLGKIAVQSTLVILFQLIKKNDSAKSATWRLDDANDVITMVAHCRIILHWDMQKIWKSNQKQSLIAQKLSHWPIFFMMQFISKMSWQC
jgi:hypothetical protein